MCPGGVGVLMAIALVLAELIFSPSCVQDVDTRLSACCILGSLAGPLLTNATSSAKMNISTPGGSWREARFSMRVLNKKGLRIPPCGVPFSSVL